MTEQNDMQEQREDQSGGADDKRFEVKWRKKGGASTVSEPAQPEPAAASGGDLAALQRELDAERQRVRELQDRWQRAAADLSNYRRRTEQDRGDLEKFASMALIQQLLPVLDNFDRALATIPGNLQMLTWIQGVMLIERHLSAILEQQGLAPIEAEGQAFSPYYHEAIAERETSEAGPGSVLQVYQRGYTMHGRVLRPALVEVAKAVSQSVDEENAPSSTDAEAAATDEQQGEIIAEEAETENTGP